jgi:hypothetical protein
MCFAWISEQPAIISLNRINLWAFITEAENVYCTGRTGSLNQTDTVSSLKSYGVLRSYWNIPHRNQKSLSFPPNYFIPVNTCTFCWSKPHLNIINPSANKTSKWRLYFRTYDKNTYQLLICPVHTACSIVSTLLYL